MKPEVLVSHVDVILTASLPLIVILSAAKDLSFVHLRFFVAAAPQNDKEWYASEWQRMARL